MNSPYWSLNTALLASQPYPLKGPYKSASPGPNEEYSVPISSLRAVGSVFRRLINKSYYEKANPKLNVIGI